MKKEDIKFIVIHHSVSSRDKTTFESIDKYHRSKGWNGCGYHFVITGNGSLHNGRDLTVVGCHARDDGMNYKSVGIALTGDFRTELPSDIQLRVLKILLNKLRNTLSIPTENILGHCEVKNAHTPCPGNNLLKWIKQYRDDKLIDSEPDTLRQENLELRKDNSGLKITLNQCQQKCQKKQKLISELKTRIDNDDKMVARFFIKIIRAVFNR